MSKKDLTFSSFMKELRLQAGLTVDQASRNIGVGVGTIEDWENGTSFPSELSAHRISSIYKISAQDWLEALRKHCNSILGPDEKE